MEHDSPSPPDSLYALESLLPQQDPGKFNGAEAFGNALSVFFKHPILLFALFIIPTILWEYLYKIYKLCVLYFVLFDRVPSRTSEIALLLGGGILYLALQTFTLGVAALVVQQRLTGNPLRISRVLSGAARRLPVALLLSCIFYGILLAYLAVIFFNIFTSVSSFGMIIVCILLLVLPVFYYLLIKWSTALPACILEGLGPIRSLRRSSQLTAKNKLKIVAFYITLTILLLVLGKVVDAITSFAGRDLRLIISILYGVITSTIIFLCPTTIYLELRRAKEYTPPLPTPEKNEETAAPAEAPI